MAARGQGRRHLQRLAGAILLGITLPAAANAEALYRYTDFGYATPTDINASGDVVLEGGYKGVYHSYGANAGKVSGPAAYGLNSTDVIQGITDSGGVTGQRFSPTSGWVESVFAQNNQVTGFKDFGAKSIEANASGQVLVRYESPPIIPPGSNPPAMPAPRAAIVDQGLRTEIGTYNSSPSGYTNASAINNAGLVTGQASSPGWDQASAFIYEDGQLKSLGTLGGLISWGTALNDLGHVVGESKVAGGENPATHAFLAKDGQMIDLGTLTGEGNSGASGINDSGQVVGVSGHDLTLRAFLWESGVMKDLNNLVAAETGRTLKRAIGINDAGQIIGIATGPDGIDRGFLLTPMSMAAPGAIPPAVPEPGTWAIFGALAIGLAAHNRRRARHRA